jgi:hypothetical protein
MSCFVSETSLFASDYAQLPADAVLFLSIRVPQAHVVTATGKVTYLPAGKVPEGELLTNRQSRTGSHSISLSGRQASALCRFEIFKLDSC